MTNQAKPKLTRLHIAGAIFTVFGVGLFAYFVSQAGLNEIWNGVARLGYGFLLVLFVFSLKLATRAVAWNLCVEAPHKLGFWLAYKGVIISEALNTLIPLGILISGTAKAVVAAKRLPVVVGLSSVAIENVFYSLATCLLVMSGAIAFLIEFNPPAHVQILGFAVIAVIGATIITGFLLITKQWRVVSAGVELLLGQRSFNRGRVSGFQRWRMNFFAGFVKQPAVLVDAALDFENRFFGFYRRQSKKFVWLMLLQILFHALGVLEVWIILRAVSPLPVGFSVAFLLESVNRVILFLFKLVPLALGVDEAGAQLITENLNIGENTGVTMTIVRKGRVLFFAFVGILLIVRSGLNLREIIATATAHKQNAETVSIGDAQ